MLAPPECPLNGEKKMRGRENVILTAHSQSVGVEASTQNTLRNMGREEILFGYAVRNCFSMFGMTCKNPI